MFILLLLDAMGQNGGALPTDEIDILVTLEWILFLLSSKALLLKVEIVDLFHNI
jgi:archaellum component FlaD/FlaE